MIIFPTIVVTLLSMFSYSMIYQSSLLIGQYGDIIVGHRNNDAMPFALNTMAICFVFILALVLFVYCISIILAHSCDNKVITLLSIVCSILTSLLSILVIILLTVSIINTKKSFPSLFSTEGESEQDTNEEGKKEFRNQLEYKFSCCGFDNATVQYECHKFTPLELTCKTTLYEPFMKLMYYLFVPISATLILCVIITCINLTLFMYQRKEYRHDEWGDTFYS
ncbi:hypothetical protein EHI8A_129730 [Entamoeba histolytica HM-1:IMSS-B]|uniref:Tetraspanin family protein n=6 Tax=Entamoeba histolytica TaxID=5759 RepID=C4M9Q1_ENTH1|nr:hypothetical protein EHI_055360 [Entamoeba histolytica HM-1:IMSS]EMD43014.1 Hypothetical protein EHI5A_158290 [Entamoeba histolytica KU27]EMH77355.1 hypothetical protein EHI8A_129730 [Entamoeba histolytica HM-1:IMSS-B]EMS11855.1 hypothetical protein KM1_205570 [Entamoeba histolytica HM-3:IMSS]ENY64216.1 hypothetical protein EHI7A_119660 [Entamoeba histolytica HM-1:IMSS-A]GAT98422.1 hypothetical protein CL6EHI_055360 [Entamoeba histolytica]|eukprot:XP_648937.2 hypothetical protein EHI_055360 [Entamoeba histolytica HM-1:IMSS]